MTVRWSAFFPSTPAIRVWIPLTWFDVARNQKTKCQIAQWIRLLLSFCVAQVLNLLKIIKGVAIDIDHRLTKQQYTSLLPFNGIKGGRKTSCMACQKKVLNLRHLRFFQFVIKLWCGKDENKQKRGRYWPICKNNNNINKEVERVSN